VIEQRERIGIEQIGAALLWIRVQGERIERKPTPADPGQILDSVEHVCLPLLVRGSLLHIEDAARQSVVNGLQSGPVGQKLRDRVRAPGAGGIDHPLADVESDVGSAMPARPQVRPERAVPAPVIEHARVGIVLDQPHELAEAQVL